MATRAAYRSHLNDKFLGLEDSGYGDIEYTDAELNSYLELSLARLYPALYKRATTAALTPVSYGHRGLYAVTTTVVTEKVYAVEDAVEKEYVRGWSARPTQIVGLYTADPVILHYQEAYALPSNDATDVGVPTQWTPLIVLGAFIQALESRHDIGLRPDPTSGYTQSSLLDRLIRQYEMLKDEMAMSLPAVLS